MGAEPRGCVGRRLRLLAQPLTSRESDKLTNKETESRKGEKGIAESIL
jgi:hypothetical protein